MSVEVFVSADGPEDGKPVVLLGSLGATHAMWDPQVGHLADRYRVLAPDTRGHGRSPVPDGPYSIDDLTDDLLGVLDRFGIARAHLIGLSLGGMTALRAGARAPERTASLTLTCTATRMTPADAWADRAATVRRDGTGAIAETVVGRWFTPGYAEANPRTVASMREMVAATPAEGYAACCEAIQSMDLRSDPGRIQVPTLVVAGREDPAAPPDGLRVIAEAIDDSRFVEVSPGAHLASWEQADAVNEALDAHLERASGVSR